MNRSRTSTTSVVALLLLLALSGCTGTAGTSTTNAAASEAGTVPATAGSAEPDSFAGDTPAPEFPDGLEWLNTERPLTLAELRGKAVLLDFWTYGCINCQHIIPDLKALEEEFADSLVVIGVHSAKFAAEGETESIRQVILRYGIEHPVVNDAEFATWNLWGAQAWPTLVLIDPAGNIVGGHAGEGVYPVFQPVIASLIDEFDAQGRVDTTPIDFRLEAEGLPDTVLSFPGKVLVDDEGGRLFVADTNHHRIVVADLETAEALAVYGSGVAGFVDGLPGSFSSPQGMALIEDGSVLLVADTGNHAIRAVDLATDVVSTVAGTGRQGTYPISGGEALETSLFSPWDLLREGPEVWVAMAGSHQLWRLDPAAGTIGPVVGSGGESVQGGPWPEAELAQPSGMALAGSRLLFADSESSSIRYADLESGTVELLAGTDRNLFDFGAADGTGAEARFQHPLGIAVSGETAYVADTYNSRIRTIDLESAKVATLAGSLPGWSDGATALFSEPGGIDVADDGRLFVADTNNHSIRVVDSVTGATSTWVITGVEAVEPAVDSADFSGVLRQLEPQQLSRGPANLVLDVRLPAGYKVNPLAPSTFTWSGDGVAIPDGERGTVLEPEFPMTVDLEVLGSGSIVGDISLVYCEADLESICLVERLRIIVPVVAVESGSSEVRVEHQVALPVDL